MKPMHILVAVILAPLILALAYVIMIMSYLLVPILMAGLIIIVIHASIQVYQEEKDKEP